MSLHQPLQLSPISQLPISLSPCMYMCVSICTTADTDTVLLLSMCTETMSMREESKEDGAAPPRPSHDTVSACKYHMPQVCWLPFLFHCMPLPTHTHTHTVHYKLFIYTHVHAHTTHCSCTRSSSNTSRVCAILPLAWSSSPTYFVIFFLPFILPRFLSIPLLFLPHPSLSHCFLSCLPCPSSPLSLQEQDLKWVEENLPTSTLDKWVWHKKCISHLATVHTYSNHIYSFYKYALWPKYWQGIYFIRLMVLRAICQYFIPCISIF